MPNSTLKCRQCKNRFRRDAEDAVLTPKGNFCNPDHATTYAIAYSCKLMEKKYKAETRARKKAMDENSHKVQTKSAQLRVNEFIRELDKGEPCRSCRRSVCGSTMQAGHYKSRGARSDIKYDPRNIYLQGSACNGNHQKKGKNNEEVSTQFRKNLIEDYGQPLVDFLERDDRAGKFTVEELMMIKAVFQYEKNLLVKEQRTTRNWRALDYVFIDEVKRVYESIK